MRRMDMKEKHVMDIMIPLKDYAVVSQDATIEEALKITEESYKRLSPEKYKHQGILVKDEEGNIVGKLTQADILRGLVQDYKISDFLGRCKALKDKEVQEFMTTSALSVDVNEELVHAIHILQTSGHRGLLVTGEGKKPIGMLRLTDIYQLVKETIIED
jgi:CBS domain-containing protein